MHLVGSGAVDTECVAAAEGNDPDAVVGCC